jgi:hypothetical protein
VQYLGGRVDRVRIVQSGRGVKCETSQAGGLPVRSSSGMPTLSRPFSGTPLTVSTHNHRFTENLLRFGLNYHLP